MRTSFLKRLGLSAVALVAAVGVSYGAGLWLGLPIIGGASYCSSTTNAVCTNTVPAGPTYATGSELIPADTGTTQGIQPSTAYMPITGLGNGYGNTTVNATTGAQTPAVSNGVSTYIYAGAGTATFTTFTFPPNPFQNQRLCLVNAGTGIVTLSSLLVGTTGQVFAGTTPTSLPVMTAVGTAGTVTLGTNCWQYNVSNTTWYRIL